MFSDFGGRPWPRLTLVLAALLWLLVGGEAEQEQPETVAPAAAAQAILSPLAKALVVHANHTGVDHPESTSAWSDVLSTAVLPRWAPTLVALGLLAAVAFVARSIAPHGSAGRDPPCGFSTELSGQAVLTRFCLARR